MMTLRFGSLVRHAHVLTFLSALALFTLPVSAQDFSASPTAIQTAINHVRTQASARGVAPSAVADLAVTDAYSDPRTGITYVYLRQRLDGVEVPEGSLAIGIGRDGRVFHAAGAVVPGLAAVTARQASLSAEAAAARAASLVGLSSASFAVTKLATGRERRTSSRSAIATC